MIKKKQHTSLDTSVYTQLNLDYCQCILHVPADSTSAGVLSTRNTDRAGQAPCDLKSELCSASSASGSS